MKKCFGLLMALLVLSHSFASVAMELPPKKANEIFIPVGKKGKKISLLTLSQISVKDFEKQSGMDLRLADKIGFLIAQRDLKKSINEDGSFNNKKVHKFLKRFGGATGFHVGGFALGFFLGLIGVLIAYLIKDDIKNNRRKWAWIGWGTVVVLYLIIFLA